MEIKLAQKSNLRVRHNRASFAHFPFVDMSAREHFAMRVAPDQSILVFDSDTNGRWPLIRVRRWWTDNPANEVLDVPGWSSVDAKYMNGIYVDVQVTPDGRYAVAFSKALWKDRSSFLLHVPKGYVGRKPDTIITVIALERWQVLSSIHTVDIGDVEVRDVRVVSNKWMAFDGDTGARFSEHSVYSDQLISIPDLKPGPSCTYGSFSPHIGRAVPDALVQSTRAENDAACRAVLSAVQIRSTEALEALIQRDSEVEPKAVKLRDVSWRDDLAGEPALSEQEKLWYADGEADAFFRHWGEYPYYDLYWQNPPFESSLHRWYGLYPHDRDAYDLERYDAQGKMQRAQTADHLLCGDASLGHTKSACGCRVIDVSEKRDALLAYCRQQRGDFAGMVQQEWLAVFRSDDLSGVGLVRLLEKGETLEAIASGDGHAYVVTLESGETLRAYAVPDPQ